MQPKKKAEMAEKRRDGRKKNRKNETERERKKRDDDDDRNKDGENDSLAGRKEKYRDKKI